MPSELAMRAEQRISAGIDAVYNEHESPGSMAAIIDEAFAPLLAENERLKNDLGVILDEEFRNRIAHLEAEIDRLRAKNAVLRSPENYLEEYERLESDNAALRQQVAELKRDVELLREGIRQIMVLAACKYEGVGFCPQNMNTIHEACQRLLSNPMDEDMRIGLDAALKEPANDA